MIDRPILVTGPMRSGNAMVAQVLHRMGYMASPLINAPIPPSWRSDYEDEDLALRMMSGERPSVDSWRIYLNQRQTVSLVLGFQGRYAVTGPYLSLGWDRLLEAMPVKPFVIQTRRRAEDVEASMAAHPRLSKEDQGQIKACCKKIKPDFWAVYEAAVDDPKRWCSSLARTLGVEDDRAVAAAAALIEKPTVY